MDDSTVPDQTTDDHSMPAHSHSTDCARSSAVQRGFGKPSPLGSILIELGRDVGEELVDGKKAPEEAVDQHR